MPVQVFYNPEMVAKLRSVGIGARGAGPSVSAPRSSQGPRTVTLAPSSSTPRSAIGAVEEAARLRAQVTQLQRDNQRLSEEIARLRADATRASAASLALAPRSLPPEDDAALRFRLLELDF